MSILNSEFGRDDPSPTVSILNSAFKVENDSYRQTQHNINNGGKFRLKALFVTEGVVTYVESRANGGFRQTRHNINNGGKFRLKALFVTEGVVTYVESRANGGFRQI